VQVLDSTRSQQEFADMFGELLPTGGGDPIPLLKTKLLVGRRDGCDIVLRFPNVSSHHCELELLNGYWRIRDLGSRNGIKVNGTRVEIKTLLPGDEVSVAKHHFEVRYTPEGDAPPPDYEDTMSTSLLEKAGLAKTSEYPRPPVRSPLPPPVDAGKKPAPAPKPSNRPDSDESIALKWLEEE
jgi:adenylate cyclase